MYRPRHDDRFPGLPGGLLRLFRAGIFPDVCCACVGRPSSGSHGLCTECRRELTFISGMRCRCCGGALDNALAVCGECLRCDARPWSIGVSVFAYGGLVRELIHRFKYQKQPYLARFLGGLMAQTWLEHGTGDIDAVVPVPLHPVRRILRGFNQAELLGLVVARTIGVPCVGLLRRTGWTRQQARLGFEARQKNPAGAFAARRPASISGKKLLLVDDVYTTGATLASAARVLLTCGAADVSVLTSARG